MCINSMNAVVIFLNQFNNNTNYNSIHTKSNK